MNLLGHQTYLKPKGVGENSMSEKAGFGKVIKPTARRGPDCMAKPLLVEPKCPARQMFGPDTMTIPPVTHEIGSQGGRIPKRRSCESGSNLRPQGHELGAYSSPIVNYEWNTRLPNRGDPHGNGASVVV
jgi:hypothetical protein